MDFSNLRGLFTCRKARQLECRPLEFQDIQEAAGLMDRSFAAGELDSFGGPTAEYLRAFLEGKLIGIKTSGTPISTPVRVDVAIVDGRVVGVATTKLRAVTDRPGGPVFGYDCELWSLVISPEARNIKELRVGSNLLERQIKTANQLGLERQCHRLVARCKLTTTTMIRMLERRGLRQIQSDGETILLAVNLPRP